MDIQNLKGYIPDTIIAQLPEVCAKFDIDGPRRLSHLLGEAMEESGKFTKVYENLNYSAQGLANTWPSRYAVDPKAANKQPNATAIKIARNPQAIANNCYANRLGNGDETSGEGWYRRGVGYIQTTGRTNQEAFFLSVGLPKDSDPAIIATQYPLASAAFYFKSNNLWPICDKGVDIPTITAVAKKVNGAGIGLDHRILYTQEIYRLLQGSF